MKEETRDGFLILTVTSSDAPEAILARLREARGEAERIILDLLDAEGLGLYLTPGHMLPPEVWEAVGESFGVDPDEAPLDPQVRLVLDADGIRSAGYLGYSDYWLLNQSVEAAIYDE